jgi:hypothetical protein
MLTKCYATLFLALVFVLFIASIDAKQQYNLTIHHASTINISFKAGTDPGIPLSGSRLFINH